MDRPRVLLERHPAAEDSDSATSQTIELMCRYIRESTDDPAIQLAAQYAWQHFGGGSPDPAMKAWAVFWFVKHNVKFVVDEAPMFRLGEANQQDLLISPSVLIRMRDPQEDCDGFTMLGAALLKALDVPFVIVTIAAGPDDPSRWSHVFLMAMLSTGPLPIDASHGSGPGWMVPAAHTFRWQAWGEDGQAVNVMRPRQHSLNGWVRPGAPLVNSIQAAMAQDRQNGLGLGQTDDSIDAGAFLNSVGTSLDTDISDLFGGGDLFDSSDPTYAAQSGSSDTSSSSGTLTQGQAAQISSASYSAPSSSSSSSFNWTSFLNTLTSSAAGVAKVAETNSLTQGAELELSNIFGSLGTVVMVIAVAWVAVSFLGSRSK